MEDREERAGSVAKRSVAGYREPAPGSWLDLFEVIAAYFGHGPLGDEEDRITRIVGDWHARRRVRRRAKSGGRSHVDKGEPPIAQESRPVDVSWGEGKDEPRRPTDDMLAEEKERIDRSEWVSWMDEVRIKHQMAYEGDPEARRWVDEVYPYEAARRYEEEVLHADETATRKVRDLYTGGADQEETPASFASSVGSTVRRMGRGGGLLSLVGGLTRGGGPVKVREYEQTRNGKRVRVKSHERGRSRR